MILFKRLNYKNFLSNYNPKKIPYKGSAIFVHLTKNNKPTVGCIALKEKDFLILLRLINKKTRIKINQPLGPNIFEPILKKVDPHLTANK